MNVFIKIFLKYSFVFFANRYKKSLRNLRDFLSQNETLHLNAAGDIFVFDTFNNVTFFDAFVAFH